jgi:hypothetical protein
MKKINLNYKKENKINKSLIYIKIIFFKHNYYQPK